MTAVTVNEVRHGDGRGMTADEQSEYEIYMGAWLATAESLFSQSGSPRKPDEAAIRRIRLGIGMRILTKDVMLGLLAEAYGTDPRTHVSFGVAVWNASDERFRSLLADLAVLLDKRKEVRDGDG